MVEHFLNLLQDIWKHYSTTEHEHLFPLWLPITALAEFSKTLSWSFNCPCFSACIVRVNFRTLMCCCRCSEQKGVPGRAYQSVGGPERPVLLAEHGAEGRRAAGAQSRTLLHLRPDVLQTPLHGGDGRGSKRGGGSSACPVHLQEGQSFFFLMVGYSEHVVLNSGKKL